MPCSAKDRRTPRCRLRAPRLHIGQPPLNALGGLHPIEEVLVGFRVLDDNLGFPFDGISLTKAPD